MNFQFKQKGIILILVLIFLTATSYLALCMLSNSLLVVKTVNKLQEQLLALIDARNQLSVAESRLQAKPYAYQDKRRSFVADHLEFNCEEGVQIYQVETPLLQSFIVIRE